MNCELWADIILDQQIKTRFYFRKIQEKSKTVYICERRFKWPEMIKLSNDGCEHRATFQHAISCRVFCFLPSCPCVPTQLLQGDSEKETVKKPGETFIL